MPKLRQTFSQREQSTAGTPFPRSPYRKIQTQTQASHAKSLGDKETIFACKKPPTQCQSRERCAPFFAPCPPLSYFASNPFRFNGQKGLHVIKKSTPTFSTALSRPPKKRGRKGSHAIHIKHLSAVAAGSVAAPHRIERIRPCKALQLPRSPSSAQVTQVLLDIYFLT